MHYIHKVGCTSVRQVPVAGTCSFRLTTQICVFQKLRSTGHHTCEFPMDIPVLTHRLPRLVLSLNLSGVRIHDASICETQYFSRPARNWLTIAACCLVLRSF